MPSRLVFHGILLAAFGCVTGGASVGSAETVYFNGSNFKAGYYIVPPDMPADGSKVWVMVDVHGAGGLRREGKGKGLAGLVAPEPVIVIVPSFTTGYQGGDGEWAEQMIGNFRAVQKSHQVHDRMFVHGHSGGGQFAHRFAFNHPEYVIGVSAHSSGSWATGGGFGSIAMAAKGIPFSISCGEDDRSFSIKGYPHARIAWYRIFASEMEDKGFVLAGQTWPGVGHGVSAKLYGPQLKECFLLATRGIVPTSGLWKGDVAKLVEAVRSGPGGGSVTIPAAPVASGGFHESAKAGVEVAAGRLASGGIPDLASTMLFLARHPASGWAENEAFEDLRNHCRKAAEAYLKQQQDEGQPLTGTSLEKFKAATEGLGIEE